MVKVTAEGALVEATCYDASGNAITSESSASPQDLFKAGDDYLIVTFWYSTDGTSSTTKHGYLVRISDGTAYSLDSAGVPQVNCDFKSGTQAFADSKGHVFYRKETVATGGVPQNDTSVIRIDVSDPANLTAQQVSAASDTVQCFAADLDGNVMYTDGSSVSRLVKRTGGPCNLPSGLFWIGLSGEMFVRDGNSAIRQFTVADDGTVSSTIYGSGAFSISGSAESWYMFRSSTSIFLVSRYTTTNQYIEAYNADGEPRLKTADDLTISDLVPLG